MAAFTHVLIRESVYASLLWAGYEEPAGLFYRTADVIFTALTPRLLVDMPYTNLPWAESPNRMYKSPDHFGERKGVLELALKALHD